YARLPFIAKWSAERALPHTEFELRSLQLEQGVWVANGLKLRDRKSGKTLVEMERGTVRLGVWDLWRRHLGEVRLVNPVLRVSPELMALMGGGGGAAGGNGSAMTLPGWSVDRLVCDYGELYVAGLSKQPVNVTARFAFDWKNLSTGEPGASQVNRLQLWNIAASKSEDYSTPFLRFNIVNLDFSLRQLLERRLALIELNGGFVRIGEEFQALLKASSGGAPQSPAQAAAVWIANQLKVGDIGVRVDDPRPEVADIRFRLNTELTEFPLNDVAGEIAQRPQRIELSNVQIVSPVDPDTRIITLRSVFLNFTLAGLLEQRIDRLTLLQPSIFISQDLFVYMDQMKGADAAEPGQTAPPKPSWRIKELEIRYGRLLLGGEKIGQIGLPLEFEASVRDILLDNLASLQLQTQLTIRPRDFEFAAMQLSMDHLRGDLRFSYPPEQRQSNVVNTLFLDGIRWRQYRGQKLWLSVTFDKQTISALFGGEAYGGQLNGGLAFFFSGNNRWVGWLSGRGVDLKGLTDVIAPQNFRMTGPADFKVLVDASGQKIERLKGDFTGTRNGKMTLSKLDDFLARIPPEWNLLKQSSTRIALEALRDYRYDRVKGDFWFVNRQGVLNLRMEGPTGKRNFEIFLHTDESAEGLWQKKSAKSGS
ncbi:MAG TPA: hypothetical protein VIS74_02075, partial [Chthoniobacterales bacterium]